MGIVQNKCNGVIKSSEMSFEIRVPDVVRAYAPRVKNRPLREFIVSETSDFSV